METALEGPSRFRDLFAPKYRKSLIWAIVLLIIAFIVEHFANAYSFAYSVRPTSAFVGDLLLDNLPLVNLNFIIIEGAIISIIASVIYVLFNPRYILFSLKTVALFIVVRAIFVSLTHVGIYPNHIDPGFGLFDQLYMYFNFQLGFFFSGHTGLPFLMALIFWDKYYTRVAFISLAVIFGIAVLLAHVHYSIDVFAAPFMAYGVYRMAQSFFRSDYKFTEKQIAHV